MKIGEADIAADAPVKTGAGGPLTITVKAEEVPPPAVAAAPATRAAKSERESAEPAHGEKAGENAAMSAPAAAPPSAKQAPASISALARGAAEAKAKAEADAAAREKAKTEAAAATATKVPQAETPPLPAAPQKKAQPRIFVPERPPDDPGPEPHDPDETAVPYSPYRATLKPQTT
jgi:hypothetical protein